MSHERLSKAGPPGRAGACGPQGAEFPATALAVRQALGELRSQWRAVGVDEILGGMAELVLAEVLNNIVEHAMAGRKDGIIRLSAVFEPPDLLCELLDDGDPMPSGALPPGTAPGIAAGLQDLPEGGFGWHLIRRLARDLRYSRSAGLNCLSFRLGPAVEKA